MEAVTEAVTVPMFHLSAQQRHAWQAHQTSAVRVSQSLARLDGDLDVEILAAVLARVARRHEILRTNFKRVPGIKAPLQVVLESASPSLQLIDLTERDGRDQLTDIRHIVEADRRQDIDFGKGTSFRAALIRTADKSHFLLLSASNLCADFATMRNLVREISQGYGDLPGIGGAQPDPIQYANFCEWQNDWLGGDEAKEGKDFWLAQVAGLPGDALAGEDGDERQLAFDCETLAFNLESGQLRAAEQLAHKHEVSLAALFLAVWQSLLARVTGRSEVVVGVTCDGRAYAEVEDALGVFTQTMPVRGAEEGLSFREVLRQTSIALREAEAWQDSFIADEVLPDGRFLPWTFEYDEGPREFAAGGLQVSIIRQFRCAERFHLRLVCGRAGDKAIIELYYDSRRFGHDEIARFTERWSLLLAGVIATPERPPAEIDILCAEERRRLLEKWNQTAAPFPSELAIYELVEARAAAQPDAPALCSDDCTVTYEELTRRFHRLARWLVDLGVRPGNAVALFADRTPETIIGLLAVLKAGGAYVALDPEQPRLRLISILEETLPVAMLASRSQTDLPDCQVPVVWLPDEPPHSDAHLPPADAQRLAYIVFTSGSTGRPKGVLVPHRGVVNYLRFLQTAYDLNEKDVILQIPDLTFDSSVRDLFGPLACGACATLVDRASVKDQRYLLRKIRENGVTCLLSVVPTALRTLLEAAQAEPAPLATVRLVLASGEVLRAADGAGVERAFGVGASLFNQYGPTECTMTSSFYQVPAGLRDDDQTPQPIGRPIPNARFYLLDKQMLPVPIGASGELYIGGTGVTNGYLNNPWLTAERFVPDPFAEPGSRLYRTGDLAIYGADGTLEFLGRFDQQIKLHGVRIELAEIEAALLEHPDVHQAVVTARQNASGDLQLAAYVVPKRRTRVELADRERYVLPNGMLIAQHNRYETDFFYEQIFTDQVEFRHGITLADSDVVFDVGANIGLFSLFVHQVCRRPQLYAFEPIPEVFATLSTNLQLYGLDAKLFQCGLSDREGSIEFSYYPHSTCQSGYYADTSQESRMLRGVIARQTAGGVGESDVEELVARRMERMAVICPVRTISDVLRESGLDRIDLLKIDTEKAELDVLRGVREEDWPKIRQIVIEVHDLDARLSQLVSLLERHGFKVVVDKDEMLEDTCLFNVYAFRDQRDPAVRQGPILDRLPLGGNGALLPEDLKLFLRARLPEIMVPSAFVTLEVLPTTPNGKVDRQALPVPSNPASERQRRAPRTATEEIIAGIWASVLKSDDIDTGDDFFALGGHSLLGTQVILRINETFQVSLALRTLFDLPTVEGLAQVVDEAILSRQGVPPSPLERSNRQGALSLSFAQQRLWFLEQLQPGNPLFNLATAISLSGPLNLTMLSLTFNEIARRHESLRTTFADTEEGPVQVISPPTEVPIPLIDLSTLRSADREAKTARILAEESRRPFDLAQGPLLRVLIVRESPTEHVVHLGMHHIVSDAWSNGVLRREIAALFEAFARGAASPLPELPLQYADFAVWQRGWLRGEVLEAHIRYWRQQLAGAPAVLSLPLDRPRPPVATFRSARHVLEVPHELLGEMAAFGRRQGVTVFMTLLAVLQTTLRHFGAGDDIVVGTDAANRTRAETEAMIGFFVNQLVLRTSLHGDPKFCELLARVRRTSIDAFAWQELPFDKLVEALQPERSLSHAQLFQVKLVLQNTPLSALGLPSGLAIRWLPVASAPAREDLLINAVEGPPGLQLTFKYNADLFGATTIARMADTFERILRRVVAEPEVRLSELDQMLDEANRVERARQAQEHAHSIARRLKTRLHHSTGDTRSIGEIT